VAEASAHFRIVTMRQSNWKNENAALNFLNTKNQRHMLLSGFYLGYRTVGKKTSTTQIASGRKKINLQSQRLTKGYINLDLPLFIMLFPYVYIQNIIILKHLSNILGAWFSIFV
jgi:hypothetical protein